MSEIVQAYKSGKSLIYIENKYGSTIHETIIAVSDYNKNPNDV